MPGGRSMARKGLPFPHRLASGLGRKHLCPVDTHILCCALHALSDLGRVASLILSLSFHIWIIGIICLYG